MLAATPVVLSKTTSAPGQSPPLGVPPDPVVVQNGVPELVGQLFPRVDRVDILILRQLRRGSVWDYSTCSIYLSELTIL